MTAEEAEKVLTRWTPTMAEYHAPNAFGGSWSFSAGSLSHVVEEGLRASLDRSAIPLRDRVETSVPMNVGTAVHELIQNAPESSLFIANESNAALRLKRNFNLARQEAAALGYGAAILRRDYEAAIQMVASIHLKDTPAKKAALNLFSAEHRWPEVSHRWEIGDGVWAKVRPDLVVLRHDEPVIVAIKTTAKSLADRVWWPHFQRYWLTSAAFHVAGMRDLFGRPVPLVFVTGRRSPPYPWRIDALTNPGYGAEFCRSGDASDMIESRWVSRIEPELHMIAQQRAKGVYYGGEETVRG